MRQLVHQVIVNAKCQLNDEPQFYSLKNAIIFSKCENLKNMSLRECSARQAGFALATLANIGRNVMLFHGNVNVNINVS